MTLRFIITLPEQAPLIDNYNELFGEKHIYTYESAEPIFPSVGESVHRSLVLQFIGDRIDKVNLLPERWNVMDVLWAMHDDGLTPVIHLVGS